MPQKYDFSEPELRRGLATGMISEEVWKDLDPTYVRELKASSVTTLRATAAAVRKGMDEKKRIVPYAATVQAVDRMGDIIVTKPTAKIGRPLENGKKDIGRGFETHNFMAAGAPFLWSHLSKEAAVGQVIHTKPQRVKAHDGKMYWATVQDVRYLFDERIPYAVAAWILVEQGIAKSVSVGFSGTDVWWPQEEAERKRLGLSSYGVVFLTSDQTELSQAQTPANQFALAQAKSFDWSQEEAAFRALDEAVGREVCGVKFTDALLRDILANPAEFPLGPTQEAETLDARLRSVFLSDGLPGGGGQSASAEVREGAEAEEREALVDDATAKLVATLKAKGVELSPEEIATLQASSRKDFGGERQEGEAQVSAGEIRGLLVEQLQEDPELQALVERALEEETKAKKKPKEDDDEKKPKEEKPAAEPTPAAGVVQVTVWMPKGLADQIERDGSAGTVFSKTLEGRMEARGAHWADALAVAKAGGPINAGRTVLAPGDRELMDKAFEMLSHGGELLGQLLDGVDHSRALDSGQERASDEFQDLDPARLQKGLAKLVALARENGERTGGGSREAKHSQAGDAEDQSEAANVERLLDTIANL